MSETPDANGWMPIATAQKKTSVLIAAPRQAGFTVCEAHYVPKRDGRPAAWYAPGDYGDEEFSQPYHPTHWQPLPKPPGASS